MSEITRIIEAVAAGHASPSQDLLPLIYDDLRKIATIKLSRESKDHTLQPTALVHEAYMRLVGAKSDSWENRAHFFAAAAEAMRRILIDIARRKKQIKRGGDAMKLKLDEQELVAQTDTDELLALNEALNELELLDSEKAQLVKLRFFAGMSMQEVAKVLEIPPRTADRHWSYARAWLRRHMSEQSQ